MMREQNMLDEWTDFNVIKVNRLTKAAVELKALVRHQMHVMREASRVQNSSLANAMLIGVDILRFLMGAEEVDGEETGPLRLIHDFDARMAQIENEEDASGLQGPEEFLLQRAKLETRLLGEPGTQETQDAQREFAVAERQLEEHLSAARMTKIEIFKLYWFCPVIQSFRKPPSKDAAVDKGACCGSLRAHHVLGTIFGLTGFALMISLVPHGDSWALAYYVLDKPALQATRCMLTNTTDSYSPWCIAGKEITLTRMTLPPVHHGVPDTPLVWVCLAMKALIFCIMGSLFGVTIMKTLQGLRMAQHPMKILDLILKRWIHQQRLSSWHLEAWKMARASLLHNDVRFILDRFEQVVMSLLFVCVLLISDAVVQYVVFNKPPNAGGAYLTLVFAISTWLCINAAVGCHYAQQSHLQSLLEMKEAGPPACTRRHAFLLMPHLFYSILFVDARLLYEASLLRTVGPDVQYVRSFIDVMVKRLSSGGRGFAA